MREMYFRHQTIALVHGRPTKLLALLTLLFAVLWMAQPVDRTPSEPALDVTTSLGKLPLAFVPNEGQSDPTVRFQAHDGRGTIFFTANDVALVLPTRDRAVSSMVRLHFEGANPAPAIIGAEPLPGTSNYFVGDDPTRWRVALPTYSSVVYQQIYPGIDLRYDGAAGKLKGTFLVASGADPGVVRWRHDGATDVRVDPATGNLLVTLSAGNGETQTLVEQAPVAWQEVGGQRVPVLVRYALGEDGSIGFALGSVDPARALVIDPTLTYSTYFGGSGFDYLGGIALDGEGNIYVAGTSSSTDLPTRDAMRAFDDEEDAFVMKIAASGDRLIFSTYLGGRQDDEGNSIAVDKSGNAYIAGSTASTNFPTQNPLQSANQGLVDAFLVKLNGDGVLLLSTYLGGALPDVAESVAVDDLGSAYIAGVSFSADFPTRNSLQSAQRGAGDAFVAKIETSNGGNASLVYSTFLGGTGPDGGAAVAVDDDGNAHVAGQTLSTDFPTEKPLQSANRGGSEVFVAKLNGSGNALLYSTYLGGGSNDYAYGIAVDRLGNAYVTGNTESTDFNTQNPLYSSNQGLSDAFVAKLDTAGSALLYSTYLGGSGNEYGYGITVDDALNAYVVGSTEGGGFPLLSTQQALGGSVDAFVTKLNDAGSALVYSAVIGGGDADYGSGITVDGANNAFVAGITFSADFPTVNPLQANNRGKSDIFVVRIGEGGGPPPSPTPGPTPTPTPTPTPGPNLAGSFKSASQARISSSESLTYTIGLHNSGTEDAIANVTDKLPPQVAYVASSAAPAAIYDPSAGTLSWSNLAVPVGGDISLSFAVTSEVSISTVAVNKATITTGGQSIERQVAVALIPRPDELDFIPPVVDSMIIGDRDVLTNPNVTLRIAARDNVGVKSMYLREWQLSTRPWPRWEIVRSSGWIPYQTEYSWTLGPKSGTHFVGVWVADDEFNVSQLNGKSLDFASLLVQGESLPRFGLAPYLVNYEAGVDVQAVLTPGAGDADIYVWYPGNFSKPDQKSTQSGMAQDEVKFTTPRAGTYLFVAHGYTSATYDLAISPDGGPRGPMTSRALANERTQASSNENASAKLDELVAEPILHLIGVDPLADPGATIAPEEPVVIYLPMVVK